MKAKDEISFYEQLCYQEGCQVEEEVCKIIRSAVVTGDLNFGGHTLSLTSCNIISKIIKKTCYIQVVNFSDCMLHPDGLGCIIGAITNNQHIKELNLYGNNIKNDNVGNLGNLLSKNTTLKSLSLKWNNLGISVKSFSVFCNGLGKNESLLNLDLRNNQLCQECISHLANALKQNSSLTYLDLRWNKMYDKGAEYLLEALDDNKSLEVLKLTGNFIHKEINLAIEQRLKSHSLLGKMNVDHEQKMDNLMAKIKELEFTHLQNLEALKETTEKQRVESDRRLTDLTGAISQKHILIGELEEKILVLTTNLNIEKQRSQSLEESLNERERIYKELSENHQNSFEALKKALNEKNLEQIRMNTLSNEKVAKEKEALEKMVVELEAEKVKSGRLMEEVNWLKNKMESTVKYRTESLEVERDMWRRKYDELEANSNAQLQRMKTLAVDKQQSLENTIMELSDKQATHILTLTERYDRLKQEKVILEEQLSSSQNTVITLQRENANLVAQIAEPAKKVAALLEELSNERIASEELKHQKLVYETTIKGLKNEIEKLNLEFNASKTREVEMVNKLESEISKLKENHKLLQKKMDQKQKKIKDMRDKEKDRVRVLHSAVNKYIERLTPSPGSSIDS